MIKHPIRYSRQEVVAENGAVASGHDTVAKVGVQIMSEGGNAIDAAVGCAFAAQIAEPGMCGIGGNGIMMVYSASHPGQTTVFDDTTVPPSSATPDMYKLLPGTGGFYGWDNVENDANLIGPLSVAIPGTVAGLCTALEKHGTMDINTVIQPAIELAERGILADQRITMAFASEMKYFKKFKELKSILFGKGKLPIPGTFWSPGDTVTFPELANSLKIISREGSSGFYQGKLAHSIDSHMSEIGGILTYNDLYNYSSDVRNVMKETMPEYRGLKYAPGDSGFLVQSLNILQCFDISSMDPNSTDFYHLMLETMRHAWTNYFAYPREPGLLTIDYAKEIADLIDPQISRPKKPLDPSTYQSEKATPSYLPPKTKPENTTTITTADKKGNIVNLLTSLGNNFGSKIVVPKTGIVLNDHMCNFDPVPGRALSLGPTRKPPPGPHVPIFFRDDKAYLAIDAPGARRSMSGVLHTIINCIDFGIGVQAATEYPRVWAEAFYKESFLDSFIANSVQSDLAKLGHKIVPMEPMTSGGFGRPTAVSIDQAGLIHAGADPMYNTGTAGF